MGRPQGGLGPPPRRHLLALTRGALLRDMGRYGEIWGDIESTASRPAGSVLWGVGDGSGYCGGMGGALLRRLSRQRLRPLVGGRPLRLVAPRLGRLGGLEAGGEPRPLLVRHGFGTVACTGVSRVPRRRATAATRHSEWPQTAARSPQISPDLPISRRRSPNTCLLERWSEYKKSACSV